MSETAKNDANLVSLLWAGPEASAEIAAMHARLFPEAWDVASVAKLLEHPGATTLIGRAGFPKVGVGFALAQIASDEAEILSIGVVPAWQRAGVGKRLVQGLERALVRGGVKRLFLEVAEDNGAAKRLYASSGFAETGRRKGYYMRQNGKAVDALVMSKVL